MEQIKECTSIRRNDKSCKAR